MAFLLKFKKSDLQMISEELGVAFTEDDTRIQLRKKVMEIYDYEEGVIMVLANTIVTERLDKEKFGREERTEKIGMEHELEMDKLTP